MPVLHQQVTGQGQTPDGRIVPIPPGVCLQQKGPCIRVIFSVAEVIAQQLMQQGATVPTPVPGLALIDTGASVTCIDEQVAQALQLPVVDVATMSSASHASSQANVYPVHIETVGFPLKIDAPRAVGASLAAQGIHALIGRDVLQNCTLFYNGFTGQITLSI